MSLTLDQMVAGLFDLRDLAPHDRHFVKRMVNVCGFYAEVDAKEIRRLYRLNFGRLEKIKGQKIDDPAGPEE